MARKHGKKPSSSRSGTRSFNKKESSMKRWETREDIPEDEIDRFHNSKDKILLEGEEQVSDEDEEEEVFALKGMPEDSSDEDEEGEEYEGEGGDYDEEMGDAEPVPGPSKTKKTKGKKGKQSSPASDASESESEEEGWGKKKSDYYASNATQIDSEDEEANELEEQEAKRLQAKAREVLTEDDFGLVDITEIVVKEQDDILEESTAPSIQTLPQDKQSLLRHLEKTNAEALALARDWDDVAYTLTETQAKMDAYVFKLDFNLVLEEEDSEVLSSGMAHLHYQALQTYATTLAFYLYLRASEKYAARPELLRAHPIMSRLLTLKQSIATLEELGFSLSDEEDDYDEEEDARSIWAMDELKNMDSDELRQLLIEAGEPEPPTSEKQKKKPKENGIFVNGDQDEGEDKKKKKSRKEKEKDVVTVFSTPDEPPKKKRKTAATPTLPVFDLVEPTFPSRPSRSNSSKLSTSPTDVADPYGELTSLADADVQDKASRKRSLRFHTSKIESSSARREKARSGAYGGDDDIPWRDRKKEKKVPEAKRGLGGDDLDDLPAEVEEDDTGKKGKRRREEDEDSGSAESDGEGYYELVKRKSKEKKEKKKAEYEALAEAERIVPDEDSASGPRSLTRAILSNKGLTPHRSKSVRNPRVKKRQKFEKAKKKVSSQKAVYKDGLASTKGRYEGEKSGVTKVIKSVKL
ncbi:Sas10 C-terminal domain-containing protein [Cristinia sonorae]|uniref:Sas10 C-terminal domain-containing protein n=1 Tax=Cristinia sonorae TaxID=1940300 RepID=A0A8K0UWW1_9AGAR|nr:Sas10 C-terminal domain-containing protein [Cristinia sonorae]